MSMKINENVIYASILNSFNLYKYTGENVKTLSSDRAYVLIHVNTNEKYYCVKMDTLSQNYSSDDIKRIIWHPANESFFWFIDVIKGRGFVSNATEYYMVFPFHKIDNVTSLTELTRKKDFLGLERPNIKMLIYNLLSAVDSLYEKGFLYGLWEDKKIFIKDKVADDGTNMFYFSYSNAMKMEKASCIANLTYASNKDISPYTAPQFIDGGKYTWECEYYSLAVMIFRLLVGKFPYEGSLMDGIPNSSEAEMKQWINEYFEHTIFIFDAKDNRNAIGDFKHEEIFLKRWNSLPAKMKKMFTDVFVEEGMKAYSPAEWRAEIDAFDFKL